MVLSKFPELGRSTIWMIVRQGPIALAVNAVRGCSDIFYSPLFFLFLPLFGKWPDID